MSDITLISLPSISKNIYSSWLVQKAKAFENLPKFFNKWEYIEKYCKKVLIKDKDFLNKLEELVKNNIKFDGTSYIIKSSEFMQYEANKIASEFLREKYDEVLKIMSEAAQIYTYNHEKFFDNKTINIINSITAKCYKESIHYEAFNLFFTLLDEFHYRAGQDYEEEILKVLKYIYIICDTDMIKIFENTALRYDDFCAIFIYNNKKLSEIDHVRKFEMAVGNIGFKNLFELYKSVRVYD